MHASLSRFLSMKGAGNVATSTAKSIPLAATLPTPFLMPWAPHGCVSCCSARSGQTKQECDTKAQNLDLRCCGWIFTKNKITGRNSPFFSFSLYYISSIIAAVHPGDAEKSLLLLDILHLFSPPSPTLQHGCLPHRNMRFLAFLQSWT